MIETLKDVHMFNIISVLMQNKQDAVMHHDEYIFIHRARRGDGIATRKRYNDGQPFILFQHNRTKSDPLQLPLSHDMSEKMPNRGGSCL